LFKKSPRNAQLLMMMRKSILIMMIITKLMENSGRTSLQGNVEVSRPTTTLLNSIVKIVVSVPQLQ
jgi:hypothetical protein